MNRYICIHSHFYQPPRENPWIGEVGREDSAYPYHNWNERITAECYNPNSASPVLGPDGKVIATINNYEKMSFNFGPTLLSWLQRRKPEVYQAIIKADRGSQKGFSGHGSAIAQVYNHMIMPLANSKDKRTQVIWGIKDFKYRFGRNPEGMWLSETAVDLETLSIMAEYGLLFTILAPYQAMRVRRIGSREWIDVKGTKLDTRMAYLCRLPNGKTINLFFYDGHIAHGIAFGDLLNNGESFAKRLLAAFSAHNEHPQLVHCATDGETFGHHRRYGNMAIAYSLYYIEANNLSRITIYGEYLEKYPPTHEVEIVENSSWSCAHGIERWRSNCGCNAGMHQEWSQEWRRPLRNAMEWLRDRLTSIYEGEIAQYIHNPWQARDEYINIILERSENQLNNFFAKHASRKLSEGERLKVLRLLEMERFSMLMFTSCGWFFDDISRIETVYIMQCAARAMQLAAEVSGISLESDYLNILKKAPSNLPAFKTGDMVYEMLVRPTIPINTNINLF